MLVIHHQTFHLDFPPVRRLQSIQVKIQMSFLKVIHTLAQSTQPATSPSHRIRDENGHFGITTMNIRGIGQQPPSSIRFSRFHNIFFLPRPNLPEILHQLLRINHVTADRGIIVSIHPNTQQGKIIRCHEKRDPFLFRPIQQLHQFRRQRVTHEQVQLIRITNS